MISTATADLAPGDLGITSAHEHIPIDKAGRHRNDVLDFAIRELKAARKLGLRTIVEVSPERDVRSVRRVSEAAEVNVIVCTGFYNFDEEARQCTEEQFYRHMMHEITEGIDNTEIRPGVVKIASHNALPLPHEVRALRGAGKAQATTGLPLCVHSVTGCKAQQQIIGDAGADLRKVYFSHVEAEFGWEGRSIDEEVEVLLEIVERGSVLCYNNFGNVAHTKEENLHAIIKALIDNGYADHQLATMDTVWGYEDGERKILWEDINPEGKDRMYGYLLSHALPRLRNAGISEEDIRKMIMDTPRRLFGG